MTRLTELEVGLDVSAVLDRVAAGEEIEVIRAGVPVAVIRSTGPTLLSADRFRHLLASAPPVDDGFAEDLRRIRRQSGPAHE